MSYKTDFIEGWDGLSDEVNKCAVEKGWYEKDRSIAEAIALMHSELSEALEAARHDDPPSEKIPTYSQVEEELADAVIRIMDTAYHEDLDVGGALLAKIEYNWTRPHKHGGKKF